MNFRQASVSDIDAMHNIRISVKENRLSNPALISPDDYREMITHKGRGWLCEEGGEVLGFAIVDLHSANIWALFVHPEHEGKGIGRQLMDLLLDWSFSQGIQNLWLSTDSGTRAESFYEKTGWERKGLEKNGEICFEFHRRNWLKK